MSFKYYNTSWLIAVILLLAVGLDFVIGNWVFPILQHFGIEQLRAPGNVALIGGILVLYDKVLWRYPILNWLVRVPHLAGRYTGQINYKWNGEKSTKECVIEISQTASMVKVLSYFKNDAGEVSTSQSIVEQIIKEPDGNYSIYFFYNNGGSMEQGENKSEMHMGANILKYSKGDNATPAGFNGKYFTDRVKQTKGEINVEFESKKLRGKF